MLLDRVEQLSRELEQVRGRADAGTGLVCDGESLTLEVVERRAILATLQQFGGHRDRTARALGIGVRTLGMKLRQWKLAGLAPEHA
jgi:DNA-binding NtrC family response regulator